MDGIRREGQEQGPGGESCKTGKTGKTGKPAKLAKLAKPTAYVGRFGCQLIKIAVLYVLIIRI
ncbi:hypothetical protein J1TS5_42030 [Paenibacillus macerans]|nr:hypothetical protein J1TS5_42030 [Paenibacillus macerans]